jgi:hypothetical protein
MKFQDTTSIRVCPTLCHDVIGRNRFFVKSQETVNACIAKSAEKNLNYIKEDL